MRILVHDYAGHPFQVQLSRALAKLGHDVHHLYSASIIMPRGTLELQPEDPENFSVSGIRLSKTISKSSYFERFTLEREYAVQLTKVVSEYKPEVVLSGNTPSIAQHRLAKSCTAQGIRLISWVQDLYGIATYQTLKHRLPVLGHLVGKYFIQLDRSSLRASHNTVVITEDFVPILRRWGIDESRIHVIHNWAPIDSLTIPKKDNPWSRHHELQDKRCLLYSGSLGMKHNPNLLIELAQHVKSLQDVCVVVVSEGEGADWLKQKKDDLDLKNLILLPFQPFSQLSQVIATGDVLLGILEPSAGVFSVPSKVLTYLCFERPLLLSVPLENLSAKIVTENSAGVVVAPDDVLGFCEGAKQILNDKKQSQEYGANARRYAEENFRITSIANRFEKICS